MRLFIAIDLPENIKEYLREIQGRLPNAKLSKTYDFHCTLKFLGSCEPRRKEKIEELLACVSFQPFESHLTQIGTFGGKKYPRVIWVGMEAPAWLAETTAEIEKGSEKLGFEKENRFTPHITLARVKHIDSPQSFADALSKIKIEQLRFRVSHFYLFESHLSPKGAVHTRIAEFPRCSTNY